MSDPSPSVSTTPVRLVLAGLGRIAEVQALALAEQKELLWVGACDPDPDKASLCPPGVPWFPSLSDCLATIPCDAVLVSTPTDTHFQVAAAVLAAGRHLLLEKPAAAGHGEVAELRRLAHAANRHFHTAFHMSRGAEVDWLVAHFATAAATGHAVPITAFACQFHDPLLLHGTLHPRAPSVLGSWLDSGINALSVVARFIPVESFHVVDSQRDQPAHFPVRDVRAAVTFADGTRTGTILTDWTQDTSAKTTHLQLADGRSWTLDHHQQTATLTDNNKSVTTRCARHPNRMIDHYRQVLADFATALANNTPNTEHSLTLHRLLMEAEQQSHVKT